jgi:hypothetical protein
VAFLVLAAAGGPALGFGEAVDWGFLAVVFGVAPRAERAATIHKHRKKKDEIR